MIYQLMRFFAAICVVAGVVTTSVLAQMGTREITQIKGDVYRFQNNFHYAIVVDTPDGIVATDPINAEAAAWLEAELTKRFGKDVKYLIMSHHHQDHASGGEVFEDTATVVAHANFTPHVEAGDVKTATPDETFTGEKTIEFGGKTIELTYLGEGHADDLIAMVVRPENVAFVVDAVSPKRLPWRDFPRTDINGLIGQLKAVEALDFDVLAPGHSVLGVKQDVTDMRVYVETLRDQVREAMKGGKNEAEVTAAIDMSKYKDWGNYEKGLQMNVSGMMRWLSENPSN
ncbi:MAG: MBL fold metallo-hydrolase [Gammaproteobacteria bacterium]